MIDPNVAKALAILAKAVRDLIDRHDSGPTLDWAVRALADNDDLVEVVACYEVQMRKHGR